MVLVGLELSKTVKVKMGRYQAWKTGRLSHQYVRLSTMELETDFVGTGDDTYPRNCRGIEL